MSAKIHSKLSRDFLRLKKRARKMRRQFQHAVTVEEKMKALNSFDNIIRLAQKHTEISTRKRREQLLNFEKALAPQN